MPSSITNLVGLTMGDLKRCEHLPLGPWPSLKYLHLYKVHAVKRIGEEFYGDGGGIAFPSLENLTLEDMPNLKKWHTESCPRLTKLRIKSCPKLAMLPCIPCSVETLEISSSNEKLSSARSLAGLSKLKYHSCGISSSSGSWDELEYLTALDELRIGGCDELTCLPENIMYQPSLHIPCFVETLRITSSNEMVLSAGSLAGLPKLRYLYIHSCRISSSSGWWNGLQYLTALEYLRIEECDKLTCLPEDIMYLPSLQTLDLWGNRNLRSLEGGGRKQQQPTPFFTTLQYLNIQKAGRLTSLPEWVRGLTSLQGLRIVDCCNLATLPNNLQCLTALQYMNISNLPQLTMLPNSLQHLTAFQTLVISDLPRVTMLPDGLRYLTALQTLVISKLPQLTMLPDGLRYLTALQSLEILDCPQLVRLSG